MPIAAEVTATGRTTPRPRMPRIDPFRILGLLLLIVIWQLLTAVLPPSSLPTPWSAVDRIGRDFITAEELRFYGFADTERLDSIIYTATHELIAVALGGLVGTFPRLGTPRFHS